MRRESKLFLVALVLAAAILVLPRDPVAFFEIVGGILFLMGGMRAMREYWRR